MTSPIITEALRALVDGRDLTRIEAAAAMEAIMSGAATNAQIAAFLTALRMKGETVEELIGSAEVSETLGIKIELGPSQVARCVDEIGIGFLYAPLLHTAMKYVMATRREMGIRTVFNMLGPLTNPAGANVQVIGVYANALREPLARVLAELGTIRAFVVHGADGLEEISNTGESHISEVHEGVVRSTRVRPEDFGLPRAVIGDLQGGDRQENADIIRRVLGGEAGPRRDIVLMNAAAALVAGGKARDLKEGVGVAAQSIDSRAAARKLDALVTFSQHLSAEAPV